MSAAIEASSFASISSIASNPPAWPPEEHHLHHHESLTLYITRVPGSRDVFLTPLKPRERVVSAQDVQSSLYYVHINSAHDVELLHNPQKSDDEDTENALHPMSHSMLPYTLKDRVPYGTQQGQIVPEVSTKTNKIARKPVRTNDNYTTSNHIPVTLPVLPPRPLPPLPDENVDLSTSAHIDGPSHNQYASVKRHVHALSTSDLPPTPTETYNYENHDRGLTLVRREPSTSDQWNVATIYDSPVLDASSKRNSGLAKNRVKKSGAPLCIDITNPAYLAFQSHGASGISTSSSSSDDQTVPDGIFRRHLRLPSTKSMDHMEGSVSRTSIDRPVSEWASVDMRKTGYFFKSPWQGDCRFITTASGRALICNHKLPGSFDTDAVSELRFNLPVSAKAPPVLQERRRSYLTDGRRHSRMDLVRGFANRIDFRYDSVDTLKDDIDTADLRLGQEMAGGGFGGRQPKLGKLIIHPPGLAMLDLLVAANVALWWRAWEKVA